MVFLIFFPFVNWNEEIKVEYNEEMLLNEIIECRLFHYSWFSKEKKMREIKTAKENMQRCW